MLFIMRAFSFFNRYMEVLSMGKLTYAAHDKIQIVSVPLALLMGGKEA